MRRKTPLVVRFFAKVKVGSETCCWNWTASKNHKGYGMIRTDEGFRSAHRVSYEIHRGPIPEGMFVCHHCDNPGCVNPDHLFIGTPADNTADMDAKGRRSRRPGEANSNSKLNETDIIAIRTAKGITQQKLAEQYGVGSQQISNIRRGISWAHVDLDRRSLVV